VVVGIASFYSENGCIGCDEDLIMANGDRLKDDKFTIAMLPDTVKQNKLLNTIVKVTNNKNGKSIYALVSDTGGFGKLNRIADLSKATKDFIECSDLCYVTIEW
jgi:rare lipoprotein A (peptidoglycan hydrolase)